MARSYGSFLVRCWGMEGGERRIEIEHIQSGGRARLTSLREALEWIDARCAGPAAEQIDDQDSPNAAPAWGWQAGELESFRQR